MGRHELLKAAELELGCEGPKSVSGFLQKMGVSRDVAKKRGCKVITTKWLYTNTGDESRPNYRSRLVGREDLSSATPTSETLTFLCCMCALGLAGPKFIALPFVTSKQHTSVDQCSSGFPELVESEGTCTRGAELDA